MLTPFQRRKPRLRDSEGPARGPTASGWPMSLVPGSTGASAGQLVWAGLGVGKVEVSPLPSYHYPAL